MAGWDGCRTDQQEVGWVGRWVFPPVGLARDKQSCCIHSYFSAVDLAVVKGQLGWRPTWLGVAMGALKPSLGGHIEGGSHPKLSKVAAGAAAW